MTINPIKGTAMKSGENASRGMLMAWDFRALNASHHVHHTTVITWVKAVGNLLPDAYEPNTTPTVGELDELETVSAQKN